MYRLNTETYRSSKPKTKGALGAPEGLTIPAPLTAPSCYC